MICVGDLSRDQGAFWADMIVPSGLLLDKDQRSSLVQEASHCRGNHSLFGVVLTMWRNQRVAFCLPEEEKHQGADTAVCQGKELPLHILQSKNMGIQSICGNLVCIFYTIFFLFMLSTQYTVIPKHLSIGTYVSVFSDFLNDSNMY